VDTADSTFIMEFTVLEPALLMPKYFALVLFCLINKDVIPIGVAYAVEFHSKNIAFKIH
jgi:hypothetical protein